jgi:hypothetical protein
MFLHSMVHIDHLCFIIQKNIVNTKVITHLISSFPLASFKTLFSCCPPHLFWLAYIELPTQFLAKIKSDASNECYEVMHHFLSFPQFWFLIKTNCNITWTFHWHKHAHISHLHFLSFISFLSFHPISFKPWENNFINFI